LEDRQLLQYAGDYGRSCHYNFKLIPSHIFFYGIFALSLLYFYEAERNIEAYAPYKEEKRKCKKPMNLSKVFRINLFCIINV